MGNSKLMLPFFYANFFNREGRRMRAVFEREVSDGTQTYRLWRCAGKPDLDYPRAENDKYLLYVEINNYLLPLGMTEFFLTAHCGFQAAVKKLYGNEKERSRHFDRLRKLEGEAGVLAALNVERQEIDRCGGNPACQSAYIRKILDEHVSAYQKAKENGGQTFPDFIGALVMDDLEKCAALSEVYKALRREKDLARMARAAAEEWKFCEEQNRNAERSVAEAVQIIREGGVLKNEKVTFYRDRRDYSTCSIVNCLMRLYQIDVPLRMQGWINKKLSSVTIQDGRCEQLRNLRVKRAVCSQKFFEYMNDLIQAVRATAQPERSGPPDIREQKSNQEGKIR